MSSAVHSFLSVVYSQVFWQPIVLLRPNSPVQ